MASLDGANAYFEASLRKDMWYEYDSSKRETAVGEATRLLSRLKIRRVPSKILDCAIYEQALCLLIKSEAGSGDAQLAMTRGVKSRSIDGASESYSTMAEMQNNPGWIDGAFYCPDALAWLSGYLYDNNKAKTGRLVGGCRGC